MDETGWFFDPDNANQATNTLPRGWLDRQPSQAMLDKLNILGNQHDRWGIIRQWSSGDYDSPEMYPFVYSQLIGYPPPDPTIGHSQRDAYVASTRPCDACAPCFTAGCDPCYAQYPQCNSEFGCTDGCFPYRCESVGPGQYALFCYRGACGNCGWSNSLRAARHTFDSITNSVGGTPTRLAPWVQEYYGALSNNHLDYYRGAVKPFRDLLAMMRGKNTPEILFWTGDGAAGQQDAWDESEIIVKHVWSAGVVGVEAIQGIAPGPYDPLMLEYTLRKPNGMDYTADLLPDAGMGYEATVLDVEFEGLLGFPRDVDYQVNVECRGGPDVEFGLVQALNTNHEDPNSEKAWHTLPVWECHPVDYPGFVCESEPGKYFLDTDDYSARRSFRLVDPSSLAVRFVKANGGLKLRLIHVGDPGSVVPSRYDLVQVIPFDRLIPGGGDEPGMALQSDLNYDGVVEPTDMAIFLGSYAEGQPAADVDLDGVVGNDDVLQYLGDYAAEAP